MGDGNSVRQGVNWDTFNPTHVRQGAAWTGFNRVWSREGAEWKLVHTTDQPPKLTCIDQNICQAGGDPGCETLSGCTFQGEQHRVEWDYTGSATGHHLAIHRSDNGGSYALVRDNIDLTDGEEDPDCCDFVKAQDCSGDHSTMFQRNMSDALGSCTTTFQYRGRIEVDGTHVLVGNEVTHGSAGTGCDVICVAA